MEYIYRSTMTANVEVVEMVSDEDDCRVADEDAPSNHGDGGAMDNGDDDMNDDRPGGCYGGEDDNGARNEDIGDNDDNGDNDNNDNGDNDNNDNGDNGDNNAEVICLTYRPNSCISATVVSIK